jgi:Tfp pilus assembly protein PilX
MDIRREDGVAMLIALMAMLLMSALGAALILTTSSETIIAGNFRDGGEGLYAADAALERSIDDLLTVADWNELLTGSARSAFIDGPPGGSRTLRDGSTIDLSQAVSKANCQKLTPCSVAEMNAVTAERPWGWNNPRWQLYAYNHVSKLLPTDSIKSSYYVVVMVADDPSENDGNPLQDGASQSNPGMGVIAMRAEAFGPKGAHKIVELTIARTDTTELERGYTAQRGQAEQNRRPGEAAVQSPGTPLIMQTLDINAGGIR